MNNPSARAKKGKISYTQRGLPRSKKKNARQEIDEGMRDDDDSLSRSSVSLVHDDDSPDLHSFASPYELNYCAEDDEYLFKKTSDFFDSLADTEKMDSQLLRQTCSKLNTLRQYTNSNEESFLTAVHDARTKIQKSGVLWKEEWTEMRFGNYHGSFSIPHPIPDTILLLCIDPMMISKAKTKELKTLYSNHQLRRRFKEAIQKIDPERRSDELHKRPGQAFKTAVHFKCLLFILRVHLCMKMRTRDFSGFLRKYPTLETKVFNCLSFLKQGLLGTSKDTTQKDTSVNSSEEEVSVTQPMTNHSAGPGVARMPARATRNNRLTGQNQGVAPIIPKTIVTKSQSTERSVTDMDANKDEQSANGRKRKREVELVLGMCSMLESSVQKFRTCFEESIDQVDAERLKKQKRVLKTMVKQALLLDDTDETSDDYTDEIV